MALAIDLFCGLGGWTEGLLAEGYTVIGFDLERHAYGDAKYPAQLVLQDVLTIHGAQFASADLIVASPPCQAYSYRAMPWKRAKALPPPDNSLFEACFRIQREAIAAAGRHIPLVVENVCGAQKWVGRARWHYGSFYLWGDVPALMPFTLTRAKRPGHDWNRFKETGEVSPHWRMNGEDSAPEKVNSAIKNQGGSWFAVAHNTTSGHGRNPDGRNIELVSFGSGVLGSDAKDYRAGTGSDQQHASSIKNGGDWFGSGDNCSLQRRQSSRSSKRKAASAHIAKIPLPLARHIARAWWPEPQIESIG